MRRRTESKLITLPPALTSITPENIAHYCAWQRNSKLLEAEILEPLRQGSKAATTSAYTGNPLEETVFEDDNYKIRVTTSAPSSTTDWHGVYDELDIFLDQLLKQREDGTARRGVWTDRETGDFYIQTAVVKGRYDRSLRENTSTSNAPRQEVEVLGEVQPLDHVRLVTLGRDYSIPNANNANAYLLTKHLIAEGKRRTREHKIDDVEEPRLYVMLKADVLECLGGRPERKAWVSYGNDDLQFDVGLTPTSRCAYKRVIEGLFKPVGKRIAANSRIGALEICEHKLAGNDVYEKMANKGLYTDAIHELLKPCLSRGNDSVSLASVHLSGLRAYLHQLREAESKEHEEITVELSLDSVVDRYLR